MSDGPQNSDLSELANLERRMAHLKRESQRINLELQALQAEGDARVSERADANLDSTELFDTQPEARKQAE